MIDSTEINEEGNELFEHHHLIVDPGQGLLRIDKYLHEHLANTSRNKIQQAAKAGNILVNKKTIKPNYKVKPNDEISIVLAWPPREVEILPQKIDLNILHEDEDVLIINKQADLVVHPGHGNWDETLLNGLAYYFQQAGAKVENGYGYLVHRIDKDTTGLLLIAKTEEAQNRLAKQFFDHTVNRTYQALVWGDFSTDEGTIEGHIGRSQKDRRVMAVYPDGGYGKSAVSHYKVLQRFGYVTLVECKLETGRTHQIRAHFKYIGHPLFNDSRYGGDQVLKGTTFTKYKQFVQNCFTLLPRQALHAQSIGFEHPKTRKMLHFSTALPDDMKAVVDKWEKYTALRK